MHLLHLTLRPTMPCLCKRLPLASLPMSLQGGQYDFSTNRVHFQCTIGGTGDLDLIFGLGDCDQSICNALVRLPTASVVADPSALSPHLS